MFSSHGLPNKPYRSIAIQECGEQLVSIPRDLFVFFEPHPYVALGAPYGDAEPWMLRKSVVEGLVKVQQALRRLRPGWKIKIFDAYRPNAVQAFMVELEFAAVAKEEGLDPKNLSEEDRKRLLAKVFRLYAIPSDDPATPPPHSTGAAVDCTLVDEKLAEVDMGSPIDENSERSKPDYFAGAVDAGGKQAHENRKLLNDIMYAAGFRRNPGEWWHFSMGDQLAVWIDRDNNPPPFAIYGRMEYRKASL